MALEPELQQKIKKKKFDEVEKEWASRAGEAPRDLTWFFEVAREMRAVKAHVQMADLLASLAETLGADDAWEPSFDALQEGIQLAPRNKEFRANALSCVRARYSDREDLDEVLGFFPMEEAEDPVRTFGELRDWLRFGEGEGFWLFGRGLGKVAEVNLALQKVKLRFEKAAPLVVRRDEARKLLTWIPADHFMLRRLDKPDEVRKEAKADAGEIMRQLLECFGRPLTASEVKECMTGVIEGGAWTSWWAKARSHPQVLPSKRIKGAFTWTGSSEEAERQILGEFTKASLTDRLQLARKHGKRGGTVKEALVAGLREDLEELAPSGSSEALDVAFLLEDLGGLPEPSPLDLDGVLRAPDAAETVSEVSDRRHREKLHTRLKKARAEDWPAVARGCFFRETDLRLMSSLYESLRDSGEEELAKKLVVEAVGTPRRAPHAFVWAVKNVLIREELAARANPALLSKVSEALEGPEFKDLKAPLREQFAEGGLAFFVFEAADFDGADHLLTLIDAAALEEHRKTGIRRAIFRKYPHIRKRSEGDQDVLWATAEAAEVKRQELDDLVRKEIPETTEAIRVAREFGDLSENFEYHAARQKHEVLSTRAARLQKEIRKVRLIDPDSVDASKVSVGTRVELLPLGGGEPRLLTVLGPWESDPDSGICSHQSEFAKAMLGKARDAEVRLDDQDFRILSIEVWRAVHSPEEPAAAGGAAGPQE